jgi:hypothetical protein
MAEAGTDYPWTLYAKIGLAFAVALALVYPLPAMMRDAGTNHGAIAFFGLVFGGFALYGGWGRFKNAQLIRNTPTSTIRSMPVGAVEVNGEAAPVEEPLTSPLTQQDACMYQLRVREYRPDGEDDSDWETVFYTSKHVPFRLDDGTGKVRIDPDDAQLEIDRETGVDVDDGELPPKPVREWANQHGIDSRHLTSTSRYDRKLQERVLEDGESAYVFGGAQRREEARFAENERNLVVREHDGTETFIVSDQSEGELLEDQLVEAAVVLALALVCLPYGIIGSLVWIGIV